MLIRIGTLKREPAGPAMAEKPLLPGNDASGRDLPVNRPGFRLDRRKERLLALVVVAVLVAAGLAVFLLHGRGLVRLPAGGSAPMVLTDPPAMSRSAAAAPDFRADDQPLSPISGRLLGEPQRFVRARRFAPPYLPVDARSFRAGEAGFILADITVPPVRAVCVDETGERWICGIMARAAAYNLIRAEPVACLPKPEAAPMPTVEPDTVVGTCFFSQGNLAVELVRLGFARPAGAPSREMIAAEEEARAARRGLWRGDWKILTLME